jgi:hypothetical protein
MKSKRIRETHNLLTSPEIVMAVKSRKIRRVRNIISIEEVQSESKTWPGNLKGGDYLRNLHAIGRIWYNTYSLALRPSKKFVLRDG